MSSQLRGVWLKIERAKEHADSLEKEVGQAFAIDANRPRLGIKFDPDSSEYVLFVNDMPDLGRLIDRWSIILGDCIYNLRSALEWLAYQIAILRLGGEPDERRVQFPICDSRDSFDSFIDGKMRRLREIFQSEDIAIMERFQPYHRVRDHESFGDSFRPLSLLREFANIDKHRLPISLMAYACVLDAEHLDVLPLGVHGALERLARGEFIKIQPLKLGTELERAKLPMGALEQDVQMAGHVIPQVTLPEGWPVSEVTAVIMALVVKIVREFEQFF